MKIFLCLICFFQCFAFVLQAQDSINVRTKLKATLVGKVTDARSGEPLSSASVYFPDIKTGAVTNAQGEYKIMNLPQGKYLVEVSFLGYTSALTQINLAGAKSQDFSLAPSVKENEAVIVTGVSNATSARRTPVPVNIISKSDLFRGSATNLVGALTKTPGVSEVSTGPAISKPFIRGLGYNRVVVVNDGVRQEGQQWGDEHGIEIDEYNVSKAEVLKGPASLMYGSDALAGVVNFISFIPPPEGAVKGNLFTTYQTNNRQRGFHGDLGGNNHGFVWGGYFSKKAAADYRNKYDGYVLNSRFNEGNFGGYMGFNRRWGFTHFYATKFHQNVGLIEGERDNTTGEFLKPENINGNEEYVPADNNDFKKISPGIPRQQIDHLKIVTDNSFNLGPRRLTLNVGFQRNQRKEFGNVLDPRNPDLYFDLQTINYNVQYHFEEIKGWKTTAGINGMHQSSFNKADETLIPEYSLFDIGAFVFTQKRYERLTLSGGLRMDNRSLHSKQLEENGQLKFQDLNRNYQNFSGSLGASFEVSNEVTLKFNLAKGFRAPSVAELASNGAHEGTNRYEYGKADLGSEKSFQADAGLELNSEHISLSSSLFINFVHDFIYYQKLLSSQGGDSIIISNNNSYYAFEFVQDNAKLYGAEFNFDIHPHPLDWLHIENSFSFVRGLQNNPNAGNINLPFIPAPRLINEIRGDFAKKGKKIRNFYVRVELDNTFSQHHPFTAFNTETSTPGYSLFNAGIGTDFVNEKHQTLINISFSANNITDVAYQNHLSRLKYLPENPVTGRQGVFNLGRNFNVKINIPITFRHEPTAQ